MRVHVTDQLEVVADHDAIAVRLDNEPMLTVVEGEARQLGLALIAADAAVSHDRLAPRVVSEWSSRPRPEVAGTG
jgi:uncharacterized protein YqgV (UPF0045/DUF77 family)